MTVAPKSMLMEMIIVLFITLKLLCVFTIQVYSYFDTKLLLIAIIKVFILI